MPGIPISQMPADVNVDGTEIIPVLQGSINKTMTLDQLTAYLQGIFSTIFAAASTNPVLATLEAVYPVGSLYINSSANTNPHTLFGFGTWAAVTDRMIIGAGSLYGLGATGGEVNHTLTINEMPAHTHPNGGPAALQDSNSGGDTHNYGALQPTGSTGGGAAHNNLPPYVAYYVWRRTA